MRHTNLMTLALRAVFLIVFEVFPVRKNRYGFPRVAQVDVWPGFFAISGSFGAAYGHRG